MNLLLHSHLHFRLIIVFINENGGAAITFYITIIKPVRYSFHCNVLKTIYKRLRRPKEIALARTHLSMLYQLHKFRREESQAYSSRCASKEAYHIVQH